MVADERPPFGSLLKRYRLAAGLTHERLAERSGVSPRTISDLERGVSRYPRSETVTLLGDALQLSPVQQASFADAAEPRTYTPGAPGATLIASGLPVQFTSFIGREQERRTLHQLLRRSDIRLVTLCGPGGVGKTRLAVQVATDVLDAFECDVSYVPLAPITDRDGIIHTILRALDVSCPARVDPLKALLDALRDRRIVLLLDNFEHLLAAAPLIIDVLRQCPQVIVLATSRAALRLSGEYELPVEPLAVPDVSKAPSFEEVAAHGAVALFVDRAARSRSGFALSPENALTVAAICARLDGLPLALELAAARLKLLGTAALLTRLESDAPGSALQLLGNGARDWPLRHQTIHDTVAWSYDLLNDDEQQLFRQLAVFAGGCTIEAAEAVCVFGPPPASVLEGLASLLDKSLIRQTTGLDEEPRVEMLETIRHFALEQLLAHGDEASARQQHARYYLAMLEATGGLLFAGAPQRNRGAAEHDNIQAALRWFVQHG
jgi:predicted ATPase/DNA-binding XRE family transcriptional regulator